MPIPPLIANIEVDDSQANRDIDTFARDTGKKIDQVRLIELRANTDSIDLKLFKLREELKKIKREGKDGVLDEGAFKRVSAEIRKTSSELTEAKRKIQNLKNTGDESLSRLQAKFNGVTGSVNGLAKSLIGLVSIREIARGLGNLADTADSFESAFAGFRKTLNATEPELLAIEQGIKNLSQELPLTTEELSKIAETGGQFGIAAQDILIFTETVGKLSTAISGVSAEEASKQLAIVLSLTGDSIQNIDKLSSSLVELGNNFKANEGQILNFAERIAGSAGVIGVTSDQVLGISAAFVDAGIEAEAGGTAVSKVFDQLNFAAIKGGEELTKFSTIAGLSAQEFVDGFEKDPAQVFSKFVDGLSASGKEAALVLDDLGLSDARLRRAFLSTAKAGGTLEKALNSATAEYDNAIALNEEFEKRLNTNTAKLQIQANQWRLWKADVGGSLADARVVAGEFFLSFLPNAFATVQFGIALLATRIQQSFIGISRDIGVLGIIFRTLGLTFLDVATNLGRNSAILAENIGIGFRKIPFLVGGAIDSVASGVEKFLNNSLNAVTRFVSNIANSGLGKIVQEALGIDLSSISLGQVNIGRLGIGDTSGQLKSFVALSEGRIAQGQAEISAFASQKNREIQIGENALQANATRLKKQASITQDSQAESTKAVENGIKQEIEAENQALQDYIDGLKEGDDATEKSNKKRGDSAKRAGKEAEKLTKEEEKARKDDFEEKLRVIEDIKKEDLLLSNSKQGNLKAEQEELKRLQDLQEEFTDDKEKRNKVEEKILKNLSRIKDIEEKLAGEVAEKAKESYSDQVESVEELEDSIRDSVDGVIELREEYQELRDDAVKSLQDIKQELKELDQDEDVSLAERQLEIEKERLDLREKLAGTVENALLDEVDKQLEGELSEGRRTQLLNEREKIIGKIVKEIERDRTLTQEQAVIQNELVALEKERELISGNITQENIDQARSYDALNESEKILFDNEKKRRELQEQSLVQNAVKEGRDIQIVQDDENGVKALVENEKGELVELQDFKLTQDAIEIQNQRALLQSKELALLDSIKKESALLQESYARKAELEAFYTGIIDIETTKRIKINDKYIKQLQKVIDLQRQAGVIVPQTKSGQSEAITTNNITNNIEVNNATAGAAQASTETLLNNITAL